MEWYKCIKITWWRDGCRFDYSRDIASDLWLWVCVFWTTASVIMIRKTVQCEPLSTSQAIHAEYNGPRHDADGKKAYEIPSTSSVSCRSGLFFLRLLSFCWKCADNNQTKQKFHERIKSDTHTHKTTEAKSLKQQDYARQYKYFGLTCHWLLSASGLMPWMHVL